MMHAQQQQQNVSQLSHDMKSIYGNTPQGGGAQQCSDRQLPVYTGNQPIKLAEVDFTCDT